MRKTVMAENGPQPAGPYSHAVVSGGFVFVSGQGPVNPETGTMPDAFKDQVRQTLSNVRAILEAAGSSLEDAGLWAAAIEYWTSSLKINPLAPPWPRRCSASWWRWTV